jgi:DNA-binding PadR family transcriptional regulator
VKLTEAQQAILTDLAHPVRYGEDGYATAQWIAESCGHFYDTPWVSSKLPGLFNRGFIEKGGRGYYRITPAGHAALEQSKEK